MYVVDRCRWRGAFGVKSLLNYMYCIYKKLLNLFTHYKKTKTTFTMQGSSELTSGFRVIFFKKDPKWNQKHLKSKSPSGPHRVGRHFRTKLMSPYIGSSPNGRFDVRFEELVSKAENPGGFLRKNVFRVHFCFFFL